MAMTRRERLGRDQIVKKMSKDGYPTYASILELFDLHLTKDPSVIGYMVPEEGIICINENLDIEQVSVIVRHEILHEFLEHAKRGKASKIPMGQLSNMAADYEISNLGYTDADKAAVRSIKLGDQILQGLVTDYDHPDWVDKTFEEMYQELAKESPQSKQTPQIGDRGSKQIQDAEDAQRRAERIKDQAQQSESQANQELQDMDMDGEGEGKAASGDPMEGGAGGSSSSGSGDQEGEDSSSSDGDGNSESDEDQDGEGNSSGSGDADSDDKEQGADGDKPSKKERGKYDDEEYKNMSPEEKKKERARRRREAAKKLKEEADKLVDEIKDVLDEAKGNSSGQSDSSSQGGPTGKSDEVFDTPEEQAERAERIAKIKRALSDLTKAEEAKRESTSSIIKEKAVKAEKNLNKYRQSSLTRFTESLNKFIRDQIARARNASWSHINKKYVYSGLLRPGTSSSARGNVPLINVYFDRSGSWDSDKTEKGKQAISTLNKYVTRGEIVLKLYYFNDKILDVDPGGRGGTYGEPIMEHIRQTKPNNVIVLTDSDISDIRTPVQVPGAVWLLWYGGKSENLAKNLSGKQLTKEFRIE